MQINYQINLVHKVFCELSSRNRINLVVRGGTKIEFNIAAKRSPIFPREQIFPSEMRQPTFTELEKFAIELKNRIWGNWGKCLAF
tara:strand:- start:430 stop:684 length:255 start_codon:yes stop_codon:yes gene_type:complete